MEIRDWVFRVMEESHLFRRVSSGMGIVMPDYNQTMEQQREATMRRIGYLLDKRVFDGWVTSFGPESELKKLAMNEVLGIYDHSLAIKLGVHFFLWFVSFSLSFFVADDNLDGSSTLMLSF